MLTQTKINGICNLDCFTKKNNLTPQIPQIKANRISDLNVNDVLIGTKKNNRIVPVYYKNGALVFQTPFLEVSGNLRKTHSPNIYQMDTLFKGDTRNKLDLWYQFIDNLETKITEQIENKGQEWFTQNTVVIKTLIRKHENDESLNYIKWPVDLKSNIFIDELKTSFNPADLKNRDLVKLIINIPYLWINNNVFGLAVIVEKILVKPYIEKVQSEYIFNESDSEIDDNEKNIISLLATEQKNKTKRSKNKNLTPIVNQKKKNQKNKSKKGPNEKINLNTKLEDFSDESLDS